MNFPPKNWEGYFAYSSNGGRKIMPTYRCKNPSAIKVQHKNPPMHLPHDLLRFWFKINFVLCFMIGIGVHSQNAGPDIQNVGGLGLGQTVGQPRSMPTHVHHPGLPNSCQFSFCFSSLSQAFVRFLLPCMWSKVVQIKSVTHMVFYPKVFLTICELARNTKTI